MMRRTLAFAAAAVVAAGVLAASGGAGRGVTFGAPVKVTLHVGYG